jgi:hypothetical protein
MIYLKIRKKVYSSLSLNRLITDYPIEAGRWLAIHRIIANTLWNELKDYPDINIVISDKIQQVLLGRFFINKNKGHREFDFIPQKSGNPYIVLYRYSILNYFNKKNVKGLKEVFLHEFYHYRQWLLNEPLKHNRNIIRAVDNPKKVDYNIKVISEALNKRN